MKIHYQIILLGYDTFFKKEIIKTLKKRITELGLGQEMLKIIDSTNFNEYRANAPAFCLYFGQTNPTKDISLLKRLISDATLTLPIVNDLQNFSVQIPSELHGINGFELVEKKDIEKLVAVILEGFSLLRASRRLFISYKRSESSAVAIQLFEQLQKNGFDVFLDTHSIRPGEIFQEELWHRMVDTDVVVLLNTPKFLESHWTTKELAEANAMSIGIVQLIWPIQKIKLNASISIPFPLKEDDFGNKKYTNKTSYLLQKTIDKIVSEVESLRARSLASRQDNIVTEFTTVAKKVGVEVNLQPEKFLTIKNTKGKEFVIIPTVGVPQAVTYNQSEEILSHIQTNKIDSIFVLYDHRNIREKWIKHLAWLDKYLPVKTIKITEAKAWLKNI